jgi:hypothetical protein
MIKILQMLNNLSFISYPMTVALKNNYPRINFFKTWSHTVVYITDVRHAWGLYISTISLF